MRRTWNVYGVMILALLGGALPVNASWFLATQVRNTGGTLSSENGSQTVIDGPRFKSYTAIRSQSPSASAATGYALRSLSVTDSYVDPRGGTVSDTIAIPFTPAQGHTYSVAALFQVTGLTVSATNPGGAVTPSSLGNVYYGYKLSSPLTFVFTPGAGRSITAIEGVPAGATSSIPGGANRKATVTFPANYTFTVPVSLAATTVNTAPALERIMPQTVLTGNPVRIAATASNIGDPRFTWSYLSGPANTSAPAYDAQGRLTSTTAVTPGPALSLDTATPGVLSFTAPSAAGQYKFRVSVGSLATIATVNVIASARNAAVTQCQFCHSANGIGATATATSRQRIYENWSSSVHTSALCARCHFGADQGRHPGALQCSTCHGLTAKPLPSGAFEGVEPASLVQNKEAIAPCVHCHNPTGNIHGVGKPGARQKSCVACHDIAAPQHTAGNGSGGVNDNNGVRAIVGEFSKWSHHVTGVAVDDAHCAACHLEGRVAADSGAIEMTRLHLADDKVHLRDTSNGSDEDFAWDPARPDHSGMDAFCMSCHDADGAVSPESTRIQAYINARGIAAPGKTASAANPFGDTISNRYDKMARPAVVDAKGQFNTSNPSHHAVLGQRYSGRTRAAGDPRRVRESLAAFDANSSASLPGVRSTIYDATVNYYDQFNDGARATVSKFAREYLTLSPAPGTADRTLGDDSVLHCGDCHTVGQYRLADVGVAAKNGAVIGAHGSNNEYLLRNFAGSDERHVGQSYSSTATRRNLYTDPNSGVVLTSANQPWLVCFNCHSYQSYGTIGNATGMTGANHAGEYSSANRCNGPVNTIPFSGYTTGTDTDGTQYGTRLGGGFRDGSVTGSTSNTDTDFSNLFGIQCANCHNAGPNNAFGGIHGARIQTYTDGDNVQQKAYRFMSGLANTMYIPGSFTGLGTVSDLNWEQKFLYSSFNRSTGTFVDNSGCYTLVPNQEDPNLWPWRRPYSFSPTFGQKAYDGTTPLFGTWGGCDEHRGNTQGYIFGDLSPYDGGLVGTGANAVRKILRPVNY